MGRKMERRLVSVVLMESTGRKGFQGKLNGPHLVLINSVFLFPAGKTLLKKGTSLTFLEYFLNDSCAEYFAFISLTSWEHCKIYGWPNCFSFVTHPGQNFYVIYWDGNPAFAFSCWCVINEYSYMLVFQGSLQPCSEEHVRVIILTQ